MTIVPLVTAVELQGADSDDVVVGEGEMVTTLTFIQNKVPEPWKHSSGK